MTAKGTSNERARNAKLNGSFPNDARSAALVYIERGVDPIPVPIRQKGPVIDNWPEVRVTPDNVDSYFPAGSKLNIGILNASNQNYAHDVDLDCPEAIAVAPIIMAPTGWVFGRMSAPASHRIYSTDGRLDVASRKFKDLDGKVIVELRSKGSQTIYPPSLHEGTGEEIIWDRFDDMGVVPLGSLQMDVAKVAAASLLAMHWPAKGSRQEAFLALDGALLRAPGWDEEQTQCFIEALATATCDEEVKKRIATVVATARSLEKDSKTTGWPRLAEILGEHGEEIIRRIRDWLGMTVPAEAVNVFELQPWPDPPGEEAFYGLAGRIVRTIEPSTEADSAALLMQLLVDVGSMVGRGPHCRVEGDRHYTNEFTVLVGRTSKARKGTSHGRIRQLLAPIDEQWTNERVLSGVSSGEGIIWTVRDPIRGREKIKGGGYEEVEKDPGVQDKRLLIYEPEFANVLKQTERQGNTASVVLRQAWDGAKLLRTLTKNNPACATDAHISVVGHITTEELQRYLSLTESANGFANRFHFVCTDRSKLLPEGGIVNEVAMMEHRRELAKVLEFARSAGEIKRDDEARELWATIYHQLSASIPGLAGAMLARGEAHVLRLSLLYAVLDKSPAINVDHLMAAAALWDYCDRSVRYVFGDSLGDPVADELLKLLRGSRGGLTRTEIRDYFQRNTSADRIGKALGLLLQHQLVRMERHETGGRPAERWYATALKEN